MQVKLLNNIVLSVGGLQASGLVELLYNKKNVNEFLIAKKLKLTINQTRNILYKLADEGLVSFVRKKDAKKGGWYTYYWTLNTGKSLSKFRDKLEGEIKELESQITKRKSTAFYYCPNCELEYNEENALLHDYTCPECGETLNVKDMSKDIEGFEREIGKRNEILNKINAELRVIEAVEVKVKVRKARAEERKKKIEREARRKEREKEKKKLERIKNKARLKARRKRLRKAKKAKRKKKMKRKARKKAKRMRKKRKAGKRR